MTTENTQTSVVSSVQGSGVLIKKMSIWNFRAPLLTPLLYHRANRLPSASGGRLG